MMGNIILTVEEYNELLVAKERLETLQDPIVVEVRGGVAYCDAPRVEIVDYDNH